MNQLKAKMMELSENYTFSDCGVRGVTFSLPTQREAREKKIPAYVSACIQDNTVTVLSEVGAAKQPYVSLNDLFAELGRPDAVTWDNFPASRVVFWFEKGIAASVLIVEPYGAISSQVYFPYQTIEGYETRWPYSRTSKSPPVGDVIYDPPLATEENPFDFDAMIATITAEPSRTPTPIFTTTVDQLEVRTATPLPNPPTSP